MTEPMVDMIDEQLPEAFFAWGGVRAVIPVSREESFDPRVSQQYSFEFEPFTLHSEETVSHISNIRTYVPFFFGANENSQKSRKRSGDSDYKHLSRSQLAANDGYDANVAVRLGNAGGVKKSKTLHDAGEGSYDYFNRTSEPSPSNLAFGALIYAPKTGQRNKRKKDFNDSALGLGDLDTSSSLGSSTAGFVNPVEDPNDKDPFGFESSSYSRRTRPRTSSGPIEDTPPQLGAPTSNVPGSLSSQNISSPATLFEYITSGQPGSPASPTLSNLVSAPSAAPAPVATTSTPKAPPKSIAPSNTASTLAAKAAAAQMLVDQVKRAEQLLVKERDRTVAAHNAALANAQNAGVTVSNTPIVDVSTARKLQQQRKVQQEASTESTQAPAARHISAVSPGPSNSPSRAAASSPATAAATRSTATSTSNTAASATSSHRHDHHHTSHVPSRKNGSHQDEVHHVKGKMKGHAPSQASHPASDIWNVPEEEERKRIKEFWLSLSEKERSAMIKLEKDAVLKKMKEQQRHTCSCSVCGRRRTAIEEELELLYDAYYEELERFAEKEGTLNLGLKTGMLSVADDLMKNEGKKFLEMMEKLADRRMKKQLEEEAEHDYPESDLEDDYEDETYEDEEDGMTEEQRLEEGKRMFQMFAAKMFEQRVLTAYREKVALEKQQKLIEEEEERARSEQQKKERAQRKREQKKSKKKAQAEEKKQKDEERRRLEEKKKEEELARKRQEEERRRKEAQLREKERLLKEEKKRKEEEKRRREEEERRRKEEEEAEKAKNMADEADKEKSTSSEAKSSEPKTPTKDGKKTANGAAAVSKNSAKTEATEVDESADAKKQQKSELFDVTDFIDPIVAQEVLGGKKKNKKQKKKKAAPEPPSEGYIPGLPPPPASAKTKGRDDGRTDATSSVIPNGVPAPSSQQQSNSTQWQGNSQQTQANGSSVNRFQHPSSPSSPARGSPYPVPVMSPQGRGMPPSFVPFRPPMMGPPFIPPFFPPGFPMGAPPFTPPFIPNGMMNAPGIPIGVMSPQGPMPQPGTATPPGLTPSQVPPIPPFAPQPTEFVESISPSPRAVPPRSEVKEKSEDDDDDMSSFLQSLPTSLNDPLPSVPNRDIIDEAYPDTLDEPELPKPAAARELFKDLPVSSPLWGDYKLGWDPAVPYASAWSDADVPLAHSGDASPTKGRSTFLRKATEDPVVVPPKKKSPVPPSPRGGLDFESRIRLAFEVIRRRVLELPLAERIPFPFDYWAKMMSRVDSELENDVNFSIDEVMREAEQMGLITTGPVDGSGDGRFCLAVHDRDVFCFLCGVRQADTVLQPCHHVICTVCLKNNAMQPIGIIGPAAYKTCPYCAKPIQRQDPTRPSLTTPPVAPPGLQPSPIRGSWDFDPTWSSSESTWGQTPSSLLHAQSSWDSLPSDSSNGWNPISRPPDDFGLFNQSSLGSLKYPSGPSALSSSNSRPLAPSFPSSSIPSTGNPSNGSNIWGSTVGGLPFFSSGS